MGPSGGKGRRTQADQLCDLYWCRSEQLFLNVLSLHTSDAMAAPQDEKV